MKKREEMSVISTKRAWHITSRETGSSNFLVKRFHRLETRRVQKESPF
jgi:hypothetical protein